MLKRIQARLLLSWRGRLLLVTISPSWLRICRISLNCKGHKQPKHNQKIPRPKVEYSSYIIVTDFPDPLGHQPQSALRAGWRGEAAFVSDKLLLAQESDDVPQNISLRPATNLHTGVRVPHVVNILEHIQRTNMLGSTGQHCHHHQAVRVLCCFGKGLVLQIAVNQMQFQIRILRIDEMLTALAGLRVPVDVEALEHVFRFQGTSRQIRSRAVIGKVPMD